MFVASSLLPVCLRAVQQVFFSMTHRNIDVFFGFFTGFRFYSVSVSIRLICKISNNVLMLEFIGSIGSEFLIVWILATS